MGFSVSQKCPGMGLPVAAWQEVSGPGKAQASHALPRVALPLGRSRGSVLLGRPELRHAPGPGRWPCIPLHVL